MKKCFLIILVLFLLPLDALYANSTSITYVNNGKRSVLIDNVPLKSKSTLTARTLYGISRDGNIEEGPIISYTGWMISGEITTMAKEPALDLLLKNKNKFNIVYFDPTINEKGIIGYRRCWLTGFYTKGPMNFYNFRATSN